MMPAVVEVDLKQLAQEAEQLTARIKTISGRAAQLITMQRTIETDLGYIDSELRRIQTAFAENVNADSDEKTVQALERLLYTARAVMTGGGPGGDLRGLMKPPPPGPFLELMLGAATNVQQSRTESRLRLKEDYYAFRDKTTPIFILFPFLLLIMYRNPPSSTEYPSLVQIIFPFSLQCYWCWLLWFYTCLALRENVLRVNGSNIRKWWIRHHYYSVGLALTVLTMPFDSPACQAFVVRFLVCAVIQGSIMYVQNSYQRRRTYTRIALGRATAMEVVSGGEGSPGQLKLLYPLLFSLQITQFTNGLVVMRVVWESFSPEPSKRIEWQACVCGILFLVMAVGDFYQTAQSLTEKIAKKRAVVAGGSAGTLAKGLSASSAKKRPASKEK